MHCGKIMLDKIRRYWERNCSFGQSMAVS